MTSLSVELRTTPSSSSSSKFEVNSNVETPRSGTPGEYRPLQHHNSESPSKSPSSAKGMNMHNSPPSADDEQNHSVKKHETHFKNKAKDGSIYCEVHCDDEKQPPQQRPKMVSFEDTEVLPTITTDVVHSTGDRFKHFKQDKDKKKKRLHLSLPKFGARAKKSLAHDTVSSPDSTQTDDKLDVTKLKKEKVDSQFGGRMQEQNEKDDTDYKIEGNIQTVSLQENEQVSWNVDISGCGVNLVSAKSNVEATGQPRIVDDDISAGAAVSTGHPVPGDDDEGKYESSREQSRNKQVDSDGGIIDGGTRIGYTLTKSDRSHAAAPPFLTTGHVQDSSRPWHTNDSKEMNAIEVKLAGMHSNVGCMEADLAEADLRASLIIGEDHSKLASTNDQTDVIAQCDADNGIDEDIDAEVHSTTALLDEIEQTISAIEQAHGGNIEAADAHLPFDVSEKLDFDFHTNADGSQTSGLFRNMDIPEMTQPVSTEDPGQQGNANIDVDLSIDGEELTTDCLLPHANDPNVTSLGSSDKVSGEIALDFDVDGEIGDDFSISDNNNTSIPKKRSKVIEITSLPTSNRNGVDGDSFSDNVNTGNFTELEVTAEMMTDDISTDSVISNFELSRSKSENKQVTVDTTDAKITFLTNKPTEDDESNSKPKMKKRKGGFHFNLPKFGWKQSVRHTDVSLDTDDLEQTIDTPACKQEATLTIDVNSNRNAKPADVIVMDLAPEVQSPLKPPRGLMDDSLNATMSLQDEISDNKTAQSNSEEVNIDTGISNTYADDIQLPQVETPKDCFPQVDMEMSAELEQMEHSQDVNTDLSAFEKSKEKVFALPSSNVNTSMAVTENAQEVTSEVKASNLKMPDIDFENKVETKSFGQENDNNVSPDMESSVTGGVNLKSSLKVERNLGVPQCNSPLSGKTELPPLEESKRKDKTKKKSFTLPSIHFSFPKFGGGSKKKSNVSEKDVNGQLSFEADGEGNKLSVDVNGEGEDDVNTIEETVITAEVHTPAVDIAERLAGLGVTDDNGKQGFNFKQANDADSNVNLDTAGNADFPSVDASKHLPDICLASADNYVNMISSSAIGDVKWQSNDNNDLSVDVAISDDVHASSINTSGDAHVANKQPGPVVTRIRGHVLDHDNHTKDDCVLKTVNAIGVSVEDLIASLVGLSGDNDNVLSLDNRRDLVVKADVDVDPIAQHGTAIDDTLKIDAVVIESDMPIMNVDVDEYEAIRATDKCVNAVIDASAFNLVDKLAALEDTPTRMPMDSNSKPNLVTGAGYSEPEEPTMTVNLDGEVKFEESVTYSISDVTQNMTKATADRPFSNCERDTTVNTDNSTRTDEFTVQTNPSQNIDVNACLDAKDTDIVACIKILGTDEGEKNGKSRDLNFNMPLESPDSPHLHIADSVGLPSADPSVSEASFDMSSMGSSSVKKKVKKKKKIMKERKKKGGRVDMIVDLKPGMPSTSTPIKTTLGNVQPVPLTPDSNASLEGAIAVHSNLSSPSYSHHTHRRPHSVVIAIDFGTTFSGYAFSFSHVPNDIQIMRKWEGGDPGVRNAKTPTTLLLSPDGEFHSFGFTARDFYHDMDHIESQKWLYFDKFKLVLHNNPDLCMRTEIAAANGKKLPAIKVFEHALRFFREHAIEELCDQSPDGTFDPDEIRWVLTVPAIWKQPAKQFMRKAAYLAGIASHAYPEQLLIALEPEAASICIRKLRMRELLPEKISQMHRWIRSSMKNVGSDQKVADNIKNGTKYMVVDCGGGTVDITVHEVEDDYGTLKELYKATGGACGSVNIDKDFEKLLVDIFGHQFIDEYKLMRPAGWVDLMIAFEARKRNANPWKNTPLNVSLPFSFIDYYMKYTNDTSSVEEQIVNYDSKDVKWSSQGMLRFTPQGMQQLFKPTIAEIIRHVEETLNKEDVTGVTYLFLAGGFAQSPILQTEMRKKFNSRLRVVIPCDVGLTILKGAVMFGLNPTSVRVRRSRLTYGVGVLNKFDAHKHPREKYVMKDNREWCKDVFEKFVKVDQVVVIGDKVTRIYTPARPNQTTLVINVYSSGEQQAQFVTEENVTKCGALYINVSDTDVVKQRRKLHVSMQFGETEIKVSAVDEATGKCVQASIDFLNK